MMCRTTIYFAAAVLVVTACRGKGEPDSGSKLGDSYLRCADPISEGAQESFESPPLTVTIDGFDATVRGLQRGLVTFGVLAGIGAPHQRTLKNLDVFLEHFKDAGTQAIVVCGGVGRTEEGMSKILGHLKKVPVPVLIIPGAEENLDMLRRVMATIRKTNPQFMDMTRIRRLHIGNATLISLPGYANPFYLKSGPRGCSFDDDDMEATLALFKKGRTNVLLSPTPPRGQGENAVDRSATGVNLGNAPLAKALEAHQGIFGIFGEVYESGGHATLADGRTAVSPGIWQESLFVQTGATDATPITTAGHGRAAGMAQIVEFSGGRARYRTILATTQSF